MTQTLALTGADLKLADLRDFDARRPRVELAAKARDAMQGSVDTVRRVIDTDQVCYGDRKSVV